MPATQGIIDPVLYSQETNELLSQADSFRDEIEALKNEVSGDVNKVTETTALILLGRKERHASGVWTKTYLTDM